MKQVASLKYGVMFKKAFSKPEIFTAFVQDVLGITFETDHVETEKSFNPIVGRVNSHFDLFAEDVKNRVIVDIQHERHEDHYDRFLHYHCVALLEQIASAKNYRPELQVFTIVVLTSGDKHKKDVATIEFDPKDLQGNALGEIRHKVIYLCPKYVNKNTPVAYREWLEAIDDTLDEEVDESHYHNAIIQQVFDSIEKDDITPDERAVMFDEYNDQQLRKKELKEANEKMEQLKEKMKEIEKDKERIEKDKERIERDKERIERDKERIERDKDKMERDKDKMEKDRDKIEKDKESMEKSYFLEKQMMVKSMLANGLTVEMIAEITALTVEEINLIQK